MPLRENQVYQIGLITAVMLMVVAGGFGYYGISSSQQQSTKNDKLTADKNALESELRSYRNAFQATLMMIGHKEPSELTTVLGQATHENVKEDIDGVKDLYDRLIKSYGVKDPDSDKKTLSSLVANLIASINEKGNQARRSDDNQQAADAKLKAAEKKHTEIVANKDKEITKLTNNVNTLTGQLQTQKENFETNFKLAEKRHSDAIKGYEKDIDEKNSIIKRVREDLKSQTALTVAFENKLKKFERKVFLIPDGYIVDVSAATRKAFVNLGYADGLYPRISFSVFGDGVPLEAGKEKGIIEIIRVTGDHQAEARIVNYDPKDPIVRRDRIVTATWDPGQKVRVAVAGVIDFDGDGFSDLEQLLGLIRKNKGELVAQSSETGKVLGKVDVNTQFLIVGDVPGGPEHRKSYTNMISKAEKFRTRQISVRDFLHLNGYHPEPTIQSLLKDDKKGLDGFKPRKPPAGASAFEERR